MIFNISNGILKTPVLNTSYPKNVTVTSGTNATFKVEISEDGIPPDCTYQWYVDDTAVSGATSSSYTRSTSSDKGTYSVYCKVTNIAGTVTSRTATLTVNKTPVLNTSYPANTSVTIHNSVTCKVTVSTAGYPTSYTYQWYKGGSAVSGATSSTYKFTPTAVGTTKIYCVVTNDAGSVTSRTATITATALYLKPSEKEYVTYKKSSNASISVSGDTISFGYSSTSNSNWLFAFKSAIDVTKYKTLKCTVKITTANSDYGGIAVATSLPSAQYKLAEIPNSVATKSIPYEVGTHEVSLTISSVDKSVYIILVNATNKGTITDIRLE